MKSYPIPILLTKVKGNKTMPQFDDNKTAQTSAKETRRETGATRERTSTTRSISSALGMSGDKTRSGQFNAELDKLLENNQEFKEILLYGKVRDFPSASVNYLGVRKENGAILAVALIFENNGHYVRDPKGNEIYFTYDMLQDKDNAFLNAVTDHVADQHKVNEEDVTIVDAQILSPEFEVTTDSARHLAYTLGTLLENLSGSVPADISMDDFPTYQAKLSVQPGSIHETMHLHRADFKIDVNQLASSNRKFTPTLMSDGIDGDAGKTTLVGFVDFEYSGPAEDPDLYQGPAEKFKPQQFTAKLAISAVDTSASEAYIFERGLLGLASIGEAHSKFTALDILTETVAADKSIDLGAMIEQMWLPVSIPAPKLKSTQDIKDALELMVYPQETYVTVLHRAGDVSNGLIHTLAQIGEGDEKYLEVLLGSLDTIKDGLADKFAEFLDVDSIRCSDIVLSSTPRVFGVFKDGGRTRSLEQVDLAHVAKLCAGGDQQARQTYGEWLAATSLERRELRVDQSQEFQIALMEEMFSGTEVLANGAEYLLNPLFLEFLYDSLGGLFDDIDMFGFSDCRPFRNRFHHTREDDRRVMRGGDTSRRFSDKRGKGFGGLGRR